MLLEPPPPTTTPREVSRFEARLVRITRAVLGFVPIDAAMPLILDRLSRPTCLSRASVDLVCDTLAKGCALRLANAGGWRRERYLREGKPRDGRLWERGDPDRDGLQFSRMTLDLLVWLTAYKPSETKPLAELRPQTPADVFFVALVYDALRETEAAVHLRPRPLFHSNPLCRLNHLDDFVAHGGEPPDFGTLMRGVGGLILEGWQPVLRERWLALQRRMSLVGDWNVLAALGTAQADTLNGFADACERAGRRDLARFLLRVLQELLVPRLELSFFIGGLQRGGPTRLAERLDVQRRAVALLRFTERLDAWTHQAEATGYLDEEYAASQLWKADWDRFGGAATRAKARTLLDELDPLNVSRPQETAP